MSDESSTVPTVFISYSHDTREHKQWVARLATALMAKHVQVVIDQWDLEPGDDVPKFMERAVKRADRVLMICTGPYVRKANDGKGGVGYEAMVVTGELVRDLGTRKFIPIIRQGGSDPVVPDCVGTRLWVNFSSDDEFESALAELVETLHRAKHLNKPALGSNPYTGLRSPSTETQAKQVSETEALKHILEDATASYRLAQSIVSSGDAAAWRRLQRSLLRHASKKLVEWRNLGTTFSADTEKDPSPLYDHATIGVSFYMPLFASLVAAAESGKEEFSGQLGWVDEILNPSDWVIEGSRYWIDFPELLLFIGQALVGGMLLDSKAEESACDLAISNIPDRYNSRETKALFLNTHITGWPNSMNHTCTVAWGFLSKVIESNEWIEEAFGSVENTQSAVSAYYQLLSFMNFCHLSANGKFDSGEEFQWPITVPLNFCVWPEKSLDKGYRIFLGNKRILKKLLDENSLSDIEKFRRNWKTWLELCGSWLGNVFQWHFRHKIPQTTLPDDLETKGLSFKQS